jgi:hypothetical protein
MQAKASRRTPLAPSRLREARDRSNGKNVKRRSVLLVAGSAALLPAGWFTWAWLTYPSDRTPEGAYLRVMTGVNRGRAQDIFAYIETAAQHACFTIRTYRQQARERVLAAYPEPERSRLAEQYEPEATAADGADVFAVWAERRGWINRLRRDLSGVKQVEIQGERASVETVRGTRYPFRRRENGIWGLTLFTAVLVAEAEKAARDAGIIEKAAKDYERVRAAELSGDGGS